MCSFTVKCDSFVNCVCLFVDFKTRVLVSVKFFFTHTLTPARARARAHTRTHARTHARTHTRARTHARTHIECRQTERQTIHSSTIKRTYHKVAMNYRLQQLPGPVWSIRIASYPSRGYGIASSFTAGLCEERTTAECS